MINSDAHDLNSAYDFFSFEEPTGNELENQFFEDKENGKGKEWDNRSGISYRVMDFENDEYAKIYMENVKAYLTENDVHFYK